MWIVIGGNCVGKVNVLCAIILAGIYLRERADLVAAVLSGICLEAIIQRGMVPEPLP